MNVLLAPMPPSHTARLRGTPHRLVRVPVVRVVQALAVLAALHMALSPPVALAASEATNAATSPDTPRAADAAALTQALAQFTRANAGHEADIAPAAEQLKALLAADPGNPLLRAYAGAATAMRARTTLLPWRKMGYADEGLAMQDKALAQLTAAHDAPGFRGTPTSLEVRFTVASTFLALPALFNRGERGARLLADVLASPLFDTAPLPFKATVWLGAGNHAAKAGRADDARQLLTKAANSGTPVADAAAAQLKAL